MTFQGLYKPFQWCIAYKHFLIYNQYKSHKIYVIKKNLEFHELKKKKKSSPLGSAWPPSLKLEPSLGFSSELWLFLGQKGSSHFLYGHCMSCEFWLVSRLSSFTWLGVHTLHVPMVIYPLQFLLLINMEWHNSVSGFNKIANKRVLTDT